MNGFTFDVYIYLDNKQLNKKIDASIKLLIHLVGLVDDIQIYL